MMSTHMEVQALLPLFISPLTGRGMTDAVSLGAMGDSYYEYLLKARHLLDVRVRVRVRLIPNPWQRRLRGMCRIR